MPEQSSMSMYTLISDLQGPQNLHCIHLAISQADMTTCCLAEHSQPLQQAERMAARRISGAGAGSTVPMQP